MKNKIIIVMGIVISMSLTACNSDMVVNNKDVVEAMAQVEETSQSIEESSIEEETTTEAESETLDEKIEAIVEANPMPETEIEKQAEYTVESLDKKMYVKEWCNTYVGPNEQAYELLGECNKGELIHLTGQVKEIENWYEYEGVYGEKGFIRGENLVAENPIAKQEVQKPAPSEQTPQEPQEPSTTIPKQDDFSTPQGTDNTPPINPNTGEPMKSGESYTGQYDNGVEYTQTYYDTY